MYKPRVIFPFTEAGLGHIMPLTSVADEFERLYGDKVECVRSQFFTESGNKRLAAFEEALKNEVMRYNKNAALGFWATFNMDLGRTYGSSFMTMTVWKPGTTKHGVKHMEELNPDLVVSTHWATNYYAEKCKKKPLTAVYCPDARINPMFSYPSDLVMVSSETGYDLALKEHPLRFNKNNLKLVPFLIRKEMFTVSDDKAEVRKKLGFNPDKFTVVLADGGYGLGKMLDICKIVLERDLPITLVPVCGKNQELYDKFLTMKSKGNTEFFPMGLIDNIFEVFAAADLFCGKSGASMIAEPCFFGVPQIITKYATNIEQYIGEFYINTVGSAMKIFKPVKVVDKIEEFLNEPQKLEPYIKAAQARRPFYGAEQCAREIFKLLCTKFPELQEDDKTEE